MQVLRAKIAFSISIVSKLLVMCVIISMENLCAQGSKKSSKMGTVRSDLSSFNPKLCRKTLRTQAICKLLLSSKKFHNLIGKNHHGFTLSSEISAYEDPVGEDNYLDDYYDYSSQELEHQYNHDHDYYQLDEDLRSYRQEVSKHQIYENPNRILRTPRHDIINRYSLTKPRPRRISLFQYFLEKFWRKNNNFRKNLWSDVIYWRNFVSDLPLVFAVAPLIWTFCLLLMLQYQLTPDLEQIQASAIANPVIEQGVSSTTPRSNVRSKLIRLAFARGIVGLTGDSLNLAANKIDLTNIAIKTIQEMQQGGGDMGGMKDQPSDNKITNSTEKIPTTSPTSHQLFSPLNITHLVGNFIQKIAGQALAVTKLGIPPKELDDLKASGIDLTSADAKVVPNVGLNDL